MSNHVYQMLELAGSSTESVEAAIQNAISKANDMASNLDWFEVVETRGHIEDGKVAHYQVVLKVGHKLD